LTELHSPVVQRIWRSGPESLPCIKARCCSSGCRGKRISRSAVSAQAPHDRDPAAAAERARPLAARLGFDLPPAGTSVEHCSIGERVRLEILRALSFDPRVLILDEPTGVLAPTELAPFLELLRRLRGEGRIVIIVTHKLGEALAVADRVTVLRHGRVAAERTCQRHQRGRTCTPDDRGDR
jgi:ABC-type uncharacterized transport system ATPase subunit